MSTISVELNEESLKRLHQFAHETNQTPDDSAATLMEEGLRAPEFPGIHFRDTDTGHQAMVPGTRVAVYYLAQLARDVNDDVEKIAAHYDIPTSAVMVSLDDIRAFPDEIERDIAEHQAAEARLLAMLPADNIVTVL